MFWTKGKEKDPYFSTKYFLANILILHRGQHALCSFISFIWFLIVNRKRNKFQTK